MEVQSFESPLVDAAGGIIPATAEVDCRDWTRVVSTNPRCDWSFGGLPARRPARIGSIRLVPDYSRSTGRS